jgi:uncharacterized membrane protein
MIRMAVAVVALLGLFDAAYLTLHAFGVIGSLACGATGGCEIVQSSKWKTFLGLPVAAWGAGYYVSVLALALVGLQDRFVDSVMVRRGLLVLTGWGVLFSAWLTWLEAFVIHAWCKFCLVSAGLAVVLFALAIWDWMAARAGHEVMTE